MRCPQCRENDDAVIDSREFNDGLAIRRRRSCSRCEHRWTTYEKVWEGTIDHQALRTMVDGALDELREVVSKVLAITR